MGTRGVLGFQMNNVIKATYKHSDCYPAGLGCELVSFLIELKVREFNQLTRCLSKVRWVNAYEKPMEEDVERYAKFSDLGVGRQALDDWYCLLRDIQGVDSLLHILTGELTVLMDDTDFLYDSFFCEWGYIINFDDNTLDTYKGLQKQADRTNPLGTQSIADYGADLYYPCRRVFRLPLSELFSAKAWFKEFALATAYNC